jgi:hypothetical protein
MLALRTMRIFAPSRTTSFFAISYFTPLSFPPRPARPTRAEGRGGRTVAFPVRTMALPAFELGEERFAVGNALDGNRGLGGNLDRLAGFFVLPTGGAALCALLFTCLKRKVGRS